MKLTKEIINNFQASFYATDGILDSQSKDTISLSNMITLQYGDVLNTFIEADFTKGTLELPNFLRHDVLVCKAHCVREGLPADKIAIPINFALNSVEPKAYLKVERFVSHMIKQKSSWAMKAAIVENNVYYYNKGFIFNNKFEPLVAFTTKYTVDKKDNKCRLQYDKYYMRFSIKAFRELNNNKLIKYLFNLSKEYVGYSFYVPYEDTKLIKERNAIKLEVIVGDFDNMFIKPVVPKLGKDINKEINKFLMDSVKNI